MDDTPLQRWSRRLRDFIPGQLAQTPALAPLARTCAVVLHGSTGLGVDDAFSDLDLWLIVPEKLLKDTEATAGTRFFGFKIDGKEAHFNLEGLEDFECRMSACEMELIGELRRCEILADHDGSAARLVARAKLPMNDAVRRAWFCFHYVRMRQYHRTGDHPLDRGHAAAALQALVPGLDHALRAAMVLDREPYPYIKWLARSAAETPTGGKVAPLVNDVLDLLAANALRHPGPSTNHPLTKKLKEIRLALVESAIASGIDEPWLKTWWEHIQASRRGVRAAMWE